MNVQILNKFNCTTTNVDKISMLAVTSNFLDIILKKTQIRFFF